MVIPDPRLRHLAICKLWAELSCAHKLDDLELAEELELQAMMLMMAAQQLIRALKTKEDLPKDEDSH